MKEPVATSARLINWWPIGALCAVLLLPALIAISYSTDKDRIIKAPVGHYAVVVEHMRRGTCVHWSPAYVAGIGKFMSRINGSREVDISKDLRVIHGLKKLEVKSLIGVPVEVKYSLRKDPSCY